MAMLRLLFLLLLPAAAGIAANPGGSAECIGATMPAVQAGVKGRILTTSSEAFVFVSSSGQVSIPYDRINLLEYGQEVGRRVVMAVVVSPMFLLLKHRAHFLTVGFRDAEDKQQALVLRLDKGIVRSTLAILEGRSGRSVTYQDKDARQSRRGG